MKSLQETIHPILSEPTPEALIALQGALLIAGQQGKAVKNALEITGRFYAYLSELQSKITARQYSELASLLDIGAVGAVALENIVSAEKESFWRGFTLSAIGEGLMIAASRQYIKAWETETSLLYTQAGWYLTEALWQASSEMQVDLAPEQCWQSIRALLAPANDPGVPALDKAVLLGRTFQMLLLTYLAQVIAADS